ncbi:hypothetical protein C8R43DRAFT_1001510 [Mycena crocata]|nr:hypothetical protein C8R43DRAFT_1001510 [Mycena crocata]
MPPNQYHVRLQHGITGGFAPPTPNALYTITQALPEGSSLNPPDLAITAAVRESGTPSLVETKGFAPQPVPPTTAAPLIDELHTILKSIPTEDPPGSEDIYGLDTSIMWGSDDLQWQNGGPQGCSGGTSMVKASDEDKAKFKRAVEIVEELVKKTGSGVWDGRK